MAVLGVAEEDLSAERGEAEVVMEERRRRSLGRSEVGEAVVSVMEGRVLEVVEVDATDWAVGVTSVSWP